MARRALLIAVAVLLPATAAAQDRNDTAASAVAQARPASAPAKIGFRAFGHYELVNMAASKTFDAVLGSSSLQGAGGGGEVLNIWKGIFIRGAFSQMKKSGERAFVFNNDVIPIGVPIDVKIRTIELSGGWRMALKQAPRLAIYGGGGYLQVNYQESSGFAQPGDDVDESFGGYTVFGGLEYSVWKWIIAGVEGQYRSVPDAIGAAGVSAAFNEKDLGGVVVRALVGIRK